MSTTGDHEVDLRNAFAWLDALETRVSTLEAEGARHGAPRAGLVRALLAHVREVPPDGLSDDERALGELLVYGIEIPDRLRDGGAL